jgi:hypothetical protein
MGPAAQTRKECVMQAFGQVAGAPRTRNQKNKRFFKFFQENLSFYLNYRANSGDLKKNSASPHTQQKNQKIFQIFHQNWSFYRDHRANSKNLKKTVLRCCRTANIVKYHHHHHQRAQM